MAEEEDIDDETLSAFQKILEKVGPTWLEKHRPASASSPKPTPGMDPLTIFQGLLEKTEKQRDTIAERLEKALSLMTPEQLILLRSQPNGGAGDPGSLPPNEKGEPKNEAPPPKPKPKRNWL